MISVRFLLPPNQLKYIRRRQRCPRIELCVIISSFFSKLKLMKELLYFHISELRIAFVSLFKNIRFEHYVSKPKSMLE